MNLIIYTCLQALNINEREAIASLIACSKDEGTSCEHKHSKSVCHNGIE